MNQKQKKEISNMLTSTMTFDEPLANYTTFGIGGPAACMVYPDNQKELSTLLQYAHNKKIPAIFIAFIFYLSCKPYFLRGSFFLGSQRYASPSFTNLRRFLEIPTGANDFGALAFSFCFTEANFTSPARLCHSCGSFRTS